ncbi:unnamed protein product [Urochloa humidicola]
MAARWRRDSRHQFPSGSPRWRRGRDEPALGGSRMLPSCGRQRRSAAMAFGLMARSTSILTNGSHLDARCDGPLLVHHAPAQLLELPRRQRHSIAGVVLAVAGAAVAACTVSRAAAAGTRARSLPPLSFTRGAGRSSSCHVLVRLRGATSEGDGAWQLAARAQRCGCFGAEREEGEKNVWIRRNGEKDLEETSVV